MIDSQKYKTLLENEKIELIKTLKQMGGYSDPENPDNWEVIHKQEKDNADEVEIADSIEQFETDSNIVNNLEIRLSEINNAIDRISNGTYGIDSKTGKEISEERLLINPAATTE